MLVSSAELCADFCCVGADKVEMPVSRPRVVRTRCETVPEFLQNVRSLMQKFPNGLNLSNLAAEYMVLHTESVYLCMRINKHIKIVDDLLRNLGKVFVMSCLIDFGHCCQQFWGGIAQYLIIC